MTTSTLTAGPTLTSRRPTAFTQLVLTNWRELAREPKSLFFSMVFPLIFLVMFSAIGVMIDKGGDPPVVAVTGPAAAEVVAALEADGITVVADASAASAASAASSATAAGGVNIRVRADGDTASIVLPTGSSISKNPVVDAVHSTGVSKGAIEVVNADGSAVFDPVRGSLPTVLMLGLLSLAFLGTAAPLVGLRQRGTLRLLGTTPVRRSTFVLAQIPARFAMGAIQVGVIAGYAAYLGYLDVASAGALLLSCALGLVMVLALGYLFASRMSNQDLATTIASLLIPVAMIFAGSMMPSQLLPDGVRRVADALPTSVLSQSIGVSLVGDGSTTGLPAKWALMAGIAFAATLAAALVFTWDRKDAR
ncbi:ABC transporter permease [Dermatophilaceae bacterium Soc4.6]